MFLQSWWNSYYILQPAFATSLFECISLNTRFDTHIDARLLFTLSWNNSSNILFHHFSNCVASHLLHFFQPFQHIFHPFANLSLTASARNILSQWLFWGSTSNSTQNFIQHRWFFFRSLRNLNVNCASFFGTCCYPAHWARPNPSRKTKDEDSLRSELYPPRAQLAVFHFLLAGCNIGWCDFHTGSWPILCLYTVWRKPYITKGWSDFVVFQVSGLVETTRVHTNPGFRVCAFQTFDAIPGFGPPY